MREASNTPSRPYRTYWTCAWCGYENGHEGVMCDECHRYGVPEPETTVGNEGTVAEDARLDGSAERLSRPTTSGSETPIRCANGVHYFDERAVCQCAIQITGSEWAVPREGMVTVYDHWGRYLGCMGEQTWQDLVRDGESEAFRP